jgi:hypothetical protein
MPNPARWSIPNRFLLGVLILYSALACVLSLHVFVTAVHDGSPLNFVSIVVQTLTTLFLPLLILGIWKPRLTSALLFAAATAVLAPPAKPLASLAPASSFSAFPCSAPPSSSTSSPAQSRPRVYNLSLTDRTPQDKRLSQGIS